MKKTHILTRLYDVIPAIVLRHNIFKARHITQQDYDVTTTQGGLDHVNPGIRLPLKHEISSVLGKVDHPNPNDMELDEAVGYTTDEESVMSEHEAIYPTHAVHTQSIKEELSFEEDLGEWLKVEMEKHMSKQEWKKEEDALIAIIKSIIKECRAIHKISR
nr:hypothetical protein [Tanacetum cinerariifolium]